VIQIFTRDTEPRFDPYCSLVI